MGGVRARHKTLPSFNRAKCIESLPFRKICASRNAPQTWHMARTTPLCAGKSVNIQTDKADDGDKKNDIQKAEEEVVLGQSMRRPNAGYPKEMWSS